MSNKVSFYKKSFKYFIGFRDSKKLDLYPYFSIYEFMTLMKLNMFFFIRDNILLEKYNEIWKKKIKLLKKKILMKKIRYRMWINKQC